MFEKFKEALAARDELGLTEAKLRKIKGSLVRYDRDLADRQQLNAESLQEQISLTKKKKQLNAEIVELKEEISQLEKEKEKINKSSEQITLTKPSDISAVDSKSEIGNAIFTFDSIDEQLYRYYHAYIKNYDITYIHISQTPESLSKLLYEDHHNILKFEDKEFNEYEHGLSEAKWMFGDIKMFFDFLQTKGYPVYENLPMFIDFFIELNKDKMYKENLYKYPFLHNLHFGDVDLGKVLRLFLINEGVNAIVDFSFLQHAIKKIGFNLSYEDINKHLEKQRLELKLERIESDAAETHEEENLLKLSQVDIDLLSGVDFELFVGNVLQKLGFVVNVTKGSGDQGVDLIALKNGKKYAIQTKRYSSNISNTAVQEIVAGKKHYQADYAWVITNNEYTKSALELAASTKTLLWNGRKLKEMAIFADY